jgi:formate dehydrogenase subunit beta
MNINSLIDTHGDPLGVVQKAMIAAWEWFDLEAMMVSMNGNSAPQIFTDPDELNKINPFKPLMTKNIAKYIPGFLQENPDSQVGVLLRPCEMRALVEKTKRESIPIVKLSTICVDCLGTYPLEDYQWRAERKGSPDQLAWESLHFARQGGIAAYRFRSACQTCRSPVSQGADINIGVIGLPVRQKILVNSHDQATVESLQGYEITSQEQISLVQQRNHIIARLLQRSDHTRQRLSDNLESILPRDLDALLIQFESCGECRVCLDNCPLCTTDYPAQDELAKYMREDVKQWMISCAGCGMCEQVCPNHLPLVTIFAYIRQQLVDLYNLDNSIH